MNAMNDRASGTAPAAGRGRSKSAREALDAPRPPLERDAAGVWHAREYAEARAILLGETTQAGFAELMGQMPTTWNKPILFLEGDAHRQ